MDTMSSNLCIIFTHAIIISQKNAKKSLFVGRLKKKHYLCKNFFEMCKIKDYTDEMRDVCEQISFRLDFYSIPGFTTTYTQKINEIFQKEEYAHRELTDEEKLNVDIDSAAESFGMNIGDIIERKNYIFKGLLVKEYKVNLYISPFYVYVSLDYFDNNKNILNIVFDFLNIDGILSRQELQNITVMTKHKVAAEDEDRIFKMLDRSAFPIMDDTTLANGRYIDTHSYTQFTIDLLRIIRKGEFDGMPRVEVSLQTRAIPTENLEINLEGGIGTLLVQMFESSLAEITRCFI